MFSFLNNIFGSSPIVHNDTEAKSSCESQLISSTNCDKTSISSSCVPSQNDKKRKLSEINKMLIENGYTLNDLSEYLKISRYEVWINLLVSEWFANIFLNFLTLEEILKLDSSILNHDDRNKWLHCLSTIHLAIELKSVDPPDLFEQKLHWITDLKKLQLNELCLSSQENRDDLCITEIISKLAKNNSDFKKLKLIATSIIVIVKN